MYKAPSWEIIEDARRALPNAIVAMGTSNESTLMVVGQEQSKDSLDVSANAVEKRLREIYTNYHMISRRKTVVGGAPAIEFRYTGMADEHQWSSTLVVVARGSDVLIYGRHGGSSVSIEEVAAAMDTIPYELLSRVQPRVLRVLTQH